MTTQELIKRAEDRDEEWGKSAVEAERKGDSQLCWIYMAHRAENRRFLEKLRLASENLGAP